VGTPPSNPGVVYFAENFQSRNGPIILVGCGALALLVGLALLGTTIFGAVLGLSVGCLFLYGGLRGRNRMLHQDILCDAAGIVQRQGTRKASNPPLVLSWQAIVSSACEQYTVTSGGGGDTSTTTTYHRLVLRTGDGAVMIIDDANINGLPALVALVGQHTPHLPYRWLLSKEAKGLPVEVRAGKYSRVTVR
jgi:hypothetical protein